MGGNDTESTSREDHSNSLEDAADAAAADAEAAMRQLHTAALDELVSVNSFFTAAVFIGLSLNATQQTSLVTRCEAGPNIARSLVVEEVIAFSCYLFSTLIAQGLKLQMNLSGLSKLLRLLKRHRKQPHPQRQRQLQEFIQDLHRRQLLNPRLLRLGMLLSTLGSIAGTVFLMLAMVSVIQIRLGLLSCYNPLAVVATLPLVTLISIGLISFISPVLYAFVST